MILSTTPTIAGYKIIETIDVARGSTVRARHLGRDIGALMRTMVGGEVKAYTELMVTAREDAIKRMIADAERIGANAIVNIRFMTATVMQGASEILAYGTAVIVEKT